MDRTNQVVGGIFGTGIGLLIALLCFSISTRFGIPFLTVLSIAIVLAFIVVVVAFPKEG